MIVLDTNVLSELIKQAPDERVMRWVDSLDAATVFTTAVTAAEMLYGVARLPEGRRRRQLGDAVHGLLEGDLHGRVEPFDEQAATHYGELVSARERSGRPIGVSDGQIAAICRKHGATLATRDLNDFEGTGIDLVDPWQ